MKIYISGSIAKDPNFISKFNKADDVIAGLGFEVINPVKLNHDHDGSWNSFMKVDLKALLDCDILVRLPYYIISVGAKVEIKLAHRVGIPVYDFDNFIKQYNYAYQGNIGGNTSERN